MEAMHRQSAERFRAVLASGPPAPAVFRVALTSVPPVERDAWVDLLFGLDAVPDDGPPPPQCVPYLPWLELVSSSADVALRDP